MEPASAGGLYSDSDFWYCLPANFDVLNCCYRQFLATGNRQYLDDPVFRNFYDRTVSDYVSRWDKDGGGIPESYRRYGRRGIGSYTEDLEEHALMGGDLVAAEFAAFQAYSKMESLLGNERLAAQYRAKADSLRELYGGKWWDAKGKRFYTSQWQDGSYHERDPVAPFDLWFGIPVDGLKTERALDRLLVQQPPDVEELSYVPEIAYRYGRDAAGYAALMRLTDPKLARREYPEVSFAAVGAVANGLMGISIDAPAQTVETLAHLTRETPWARLRHVPVMQNEIAVEHRALEETKLTNEDGPAILWKACFPGHPVQLQVDGKRAESIEGRGANGQIYNCTVVTVKSGRSHVAHAVR